MSDTVTHEHHDPAPSIYWRCGLVWISLTLLLATTCFLVFVPLGFWNGPISLIIAAVKAALVIYFFMELKDARPVIRLQLLIPLLFVLALFALSSSDVFSRA